MFDLRCEKDALVAALTPAAQATSKATSSYPVFSCIILAADADTNTLTATGSDMETTIRTTTICKVDAGDTKSTAIPAKILVDIIKAMPDGAIRLQWDGVTNSTLSITSADVNFSLLCSNAEEHLAYRELETGTEINAALLADALGKVIKAASGDQSRPILCAVMFERADTGTRLVATDSYRLAVADLPDGALTLAETVLVPADALALALKYFPKGDDATVSLAVGEGSAQFFLGDMTLTTRLIDGDFPNYRPLFPTEFPLELSGQVAEVVPVLKRVSLMSDSTNAVRFGFEDGDPELSAKTLDLGETVESVPVVVETADESLLGDWSAAFNSTYLAEGIASVGDGEFVFRLINGLKPAVLRAVDGGEGGVSFEYLLMPIRIS